MTGLPQNIATIIPTCDRPALVTRAVESVLRQTLPADEIIVIDNGRTALPEGWLPEGVKVVRTSPRIGVGRARNLGAAAAHGEFVAFLDDDDTWEPRHLSCLAGAIGEKPKSVAVGTIVLVDERGTQLSRTLLPASPELQRTLYFRNPGFGGCNFMIRREAFLALGGFDESFPASEDRDLAVRLIENGYHLVPVPEAVVYALEHRQERSRPHHLKGNALFLRKHWRAMTWDERRRCVQRIAGRARNRLFDELKRPLRRWITRAS